MGDLPPRPTSEHCRGHLVQKIDHLVEGDTAPAGGIAAEETFRGAGAADETFEAQAARRREAGP